MRKLSVIILAIGALAFAACGDDTKGKTPDKGKKTADGKPPTGDGPTGTPDTGKPPTGDGKTPTGDGGGVKCGAPKKAVANSGKICTTDQKVCTTDEICVGFKNSTGAQVGMCLGKCCPNLADTKDPANQCPTGSVTKALSICGLSLKDSTDMTCVWGCSITISGTTNTYDCPNATDYECIAISTTQPDYKFCVPKK